jgi:hypothetical protein
MFDIDDTLIDVETHEPINEIVELLNRSIEYGYKVIIITARLIDYYQITIDELSKNQIRYHYLYMRKHTDNINTFKNIIKKNLYHFNNIKIIMSVGDHFIDVDGEYSGFTIKLPNRRDSRLYIQNKIIE